MLLQLLSSLSHLLYLQLQVSINFFSRADLFLVLLLVRLHGIGHPSDLLVPRSQVLPQTVTLLLKLSKLLDITIELGHEALVCLLLFK